MSAVPNGAFVGPRQWCLLLLWDISSLLALAAQASRGFLLFSEQLRDWLY